MHELFQKQHSLILKWDYFLGLQGLGLRIKKIKIIDNFMYERLLFNILMC